MKLPLRFASFALAACVLAPTALVRAEGTDTSIPDTIAPVDTTAPVEIATTTTVPVTTSTTVPPPSRPRRGPAKIGFARVVLSEQRAYIYNTHRRLIATILVSTGLENSTPVGTYKVFSRSAQAYYTPNPNERMRWMTRFTKGRQGGNIGFHGIPYKVTKSGEIPFPTPLGEAPSSHGCIRVRVADAKWLFQNMKIGTVVSVVRSRR